MWGYWWWGICFYAINEYDNLKAELVHENYEACSVYMVSEWDNGQDTVQVMVSREVRTSQISHLGSQMFSQGTHFPRKHKRLDKRKDVPRLPKADGCSKSCSKSSQVFFPETDPLQLRNSHKSAKDATSIYQRLTSKKWCVTVKLLLC